MAALVQKQIESLWAQLEQLLRQQAEKKNEDATVQPDKKEEKKTIQIPLAPLIFTSK